MILEAGRTCLWETWEAGETSAPLELCHWSLILLPQEPKPTSGFCRQIQESRATNINPSPFKILFKEIESSNCH